MPTDNDGINTSLSSGDQALTTFSGDGTNEVPSNSSINHAPPPKGKIPSRTSHRHSNTGVSRAMIAVVTICGIIASVGLIFYSFCHCYLTKDKGMCSKKFMQSWQSKSQALYTIIHLRGRGLAGDATPALFPLRACLDETTFSIYESGRPTAL